jgi:hypothetical protein
LPDDALKIVARGAALTRKTRRGVRARTLLIQFLYIALEFFKEASSPI